MQQKYDLAVIGGGPAGYIAAIRAAQLGASVVLIEKDKLGGTCLNRGCIPTKALIACTSLFEKTKKAESFGITADNVAIDLKKIIDRKNKIVEKLVKGVAFLLEKNKVEVAFGDGKVLGSGEIEVENVEHGKLSVESRKIILATGSHPTPLPGIPFDGKKFLSSDNLMEAQAVPEKLDIVGGGIIGLHFAAIFSTLGTEVTIYEALPEILPGIDEELVSQVKKILARKKVVINTNVKFKADMSCGKTLICVGRTPAIKGLKVNEKMETEMPGVYAAGDVVSRKMLAHVAFEQGLIAAENALGGNKTFNYENIPVSLYTSPEIGSIGLTEKEAREKFSDVKIGKFPYSALGIAHAMGETEGFIKVITVSNGKIIGAHILGAEATTLIGTVALAIKNDLPVEKLAALFQAHPSYPEGLQEAGLAALMRSLHS